MKKIIAAIFAHPDDEAFGPSGTIAKLTKEGNDVYILCATKGEEGEQHKKEDTRQIHEIREEELRCSAKTLGVKDVFFLGFRDGTLSNNIYHKVAAKITGILKQINADMILTEEHRGLSGHLDHIAISMISSYVFEHLDSVKTIYYHCIGKEHRTALDKYRPEGYFVFFPPGYKLSEVDMTIDVSDVWDIKLKAMDCHKSQMKDVMRIQKMLAETPKHELFFVRNK